MLVSEKPNGGTKNEYIMSFLSLPFAVGGGNQSLKVQFSRGVAWVENIEASTLLTHYG